MRAIQPDAALLAFIFNHELFIKINANVGLVKRRWIGDATLQSAHAYFTL